MTSKWIKDLIIAIFRGKSDEDEGPDEIIERVDKLLKRASLSTDDEKLHDDIRKEISDNGN